MESKLIQRQVRAFSLMPSEINLLYLKYPDYVQNFLYSFNKGPKQPIYSFPKDHPIVRQTVADIGIHAFTVVNPFFGKAVLSFTTNENVLPDTLQGVFSHELGHIVEIYRQEGPMLGKFPARPDEELKADLYEWVAIGASKLLPAALDLIQKGK